MAGDQVRGVLRGHRREDDEVADLGIVDATRTVKVDGQEIETEIEIETETGIAIEIDATGKDGTAVDGAPRSPGDHLDLEESKSPKPVGRTVGRTLEV